MFKIPLIRGRMFTDRDDANAPRVVVINEGLAKQFWPNSEPAGQRITIGKGVGPEFEEPPREIIGIVADVRDQGLDNQPDPSMYMAQMNDGVTTPINTPANASAMPPGATQRRGTELRPLRD